MMLCQVVVQNEEAIISYLSMSPFLDCSLDQDSLFGSRRIDTQYFSPVSIFIAKVVVI